MRVRGKRPALEAKQFDGTEQSAKSILDFMNDPSRARYIPASIVLDGGTVFARSIPRGFWVVKDTDGSYTTVSDETFHQRYEPVE